MYTHTWYMRVKGRIISEGGRYIRCKTMEGSAKQNYRRWANTWCLGWAVIENSKALRRASRLTWVRSEKRWKEENFMRKGRRRSFVPSEKFASFLWTCRHLLPKPFRCMKKGSILLLSISTLLNVSYCIWVVLCVCWGKIQNLQYRMEISVT